MEKNFLTMENKDIPLGIGQKVQVVKSLSIAESEIKSFCESKKMSATATEKYKKRVDSSFDLINAKIKEGLVGKIVSSVFGENFVVKFDYEDDSFQFNIDEVDLTKRCYLVLTKEHLIPIEENGNLEGLALAIYKKKKGAEQNILSEIKQVNSAIISHSKSIEELRDKFSKVSTDINLEKEKKVGLLAKLEESNVEDTLLKKQIDKLKNNEKIENVVVAEHRGDTFVIVRTKELKYISPRTMYNQGYFTLVFGLVSNTLRVYGSKYFNSNCNPCVGSGGDVCFGEDSSRYLGMLRNGDIIPLIFAVIPFLEEPNYASPHRQDFDTFFAQELKPNSNFDYKILPNYVTKIETFFDIVSHNFDNNQYNKDMESKVGKKIKRLTSSSRPAQPITEDDDSPF